MFKSHISFSKVSNFGKAVLYNSLVGVSPTNVNNKKDVQNRWREH